MALPGAASDGTVTAFLPAGCAVYSTNPAFEGLPRPNVRGRTVRLHRRPAPYDTQVTWAGSGGYWCSADLLDVEVFDRDGSPYAGHYVAELPAAELRQMLAGAEDVELLQLSGRPCRPGEVSTEGPGQLARWEVLGTGLVELAVRARVSGRTRLLRVLLSGEQYMDRGDSLYRPVL